MLALDEGGPGGGDTEPAEQAYCTGPRLDTSLAQPLGEQPHLLDGAGPHGLWLGADVVVPDLGELLVRGVPT
ncbi:hypothetical protein [Streptomyces canus]|uniref:hypothetical protein n=1 Tax=Streptomyces canus TaxID=58343 RepID=UPI0036E11932